MRADQTILRGLPVTVTSRTRTVLDCAGLADAAAIRDRALQRSTTLALLESALERLAPGYGAAAAHRLVRLRSPHGSPEPAFVGSRNHRPRSRPRAP
jgi:hypothetical protein